MLPAGRGRGATPTDAAARGGPDRGDTSGRFALEVLHLKLNLFSQLCHGLRAYHAKCREPHLDVSPTQVMVDIVPGSTNLPARWTFRVRLIGIAGPHRFATEGARASGSKDDW